MSLTLVSLQPNHLKLPLVLLKIHTIPSRILILDHLEIIRAQPKRLQDAVAEILELAPHLAHLLLLRGLGQRRELAELAPHGALVGGGQARHGGQGLVVLLGAGEVVPAGGRGAGAGAAEEGLEADAVDVGLEGLESGVWLWRGGGGGVLGAGGDDFLLDVFLILLDLLHILLGTI